MSGASSSHCPEGGVLLAGHPRVGMCRSHLTKKWRLFSCNWSSSRWTLHIHTLHTPSLFLGGLISTWDLRSQSKELRRTVHHAPFITSSKHWATWGTRALQQAVLLIRSSSWCCTIGASQECEFTELIQGSDYRWATSAFYFQSLFPKYFLPFDHSTSAN